MNMESKRNRGLGRGLGAILGDTAQRPAVTHLSETQAASAQPATGPRTLPVAELQPGTLQPRRTFDDAALDGLAQSIARQGVLEPLLVRPLDAGGFEIVAGERRWRAAQRAQLHEVPVIVKQLDDKAALEVALIENIQREDLSALEEADAYRRLIDEFDYTQDQLGHALGRSRSHVANTLRLLNLPTDVQAMVHDNRLTAGHARALLNTPDPIGLAREVAKRGLTVRQTEKMAAQAAGDAPRRRPTKGLTGAPAKDADTAALETALSDALGLSVSLSHRADGGGEVVVSYRTLEQLDDLCRRLQRPFVDDA